MLTKYGHALASYVLLALGLAHWVTARRLTDAEQQPAATAEPAD